MAVVPELLFPEPLFMTVEQYRQLAEQPGIMQELHWGQLVTVTFPKMKHARLQLRLVELLRPPAKHIGVVATEVAFRALPEYDLRGADVAFVSQARWGDTDDEDNLHGSPELVIEILSRSNTQSEMREKAALCLATGTEEFWIVNPHKKNITVIARGIKPCLYITDSQIPLTLFAASSPSLKSSTSRPVPVKAIALKHIHWKPLSFVTPSLPHHASKDQEEKITS